MSYQSLPFYDFLHHCAFGSGDANRVDGGWQEADEEGVGPVELSDQSADKVNYVNMKYLYTFNV